MPTRATGMGATCLGWRWWWGYRRRYASERSSRKPTRWRLSCALIWTCCWHWHRCIGAAGGGCSAVDCVEEAIVMVVVEMGCRRRCSSGRSSRKPTRWRLRCALIRPCCWHWPRCIGAAGGGSSAVDCVGGEAIVMSVVMGCRRRCSSGRSGRKQHSGGWGTRISLSSTGKKEDMPQAAGAKAVAAAAGVQDHLD